MFPGLVSSASFLGAQTAVVKPLASVSCSGFEYHLGQHRWRDLWMKLHRCERSACSHGPLVTVLSAFRNDRPVCFLLTLSVQPWLLPPICVIHDRTFF